MTTVWYEELGIEPVAVVIIALALMLATGFLMTRITKRLHLPNVTAYIMGGILIGPYVLNLVPERILKGTAFLPDIALAFIAFSTGEFFQMEKLRKNGGKVVIITVMESVLAAVLVFFLTCFVLNLDLAFSVVLAALATATAPASTIMTIRQTGAKGDFVETLLQVMALDDVVGLVLYSVAISVAVASLSGGGFQLSSVMIPVLQNMMMLVLGAVFGLLMKLNIANRQKSDNRIIISIAFIFGYCGICAAAGISPLLGCMMMGMVYINTSGDSLLFRQLNYFTPPILLLFFVRSGVSFDLGALTGSSGSIGSAPLAVIGVMYFLVRIVGKYMGAFIGCQMVGKNRKVRDYLGLALIPQAGVAIGLAALGARTLGGEMGRGLETIILSSSVLYELIGPGCAKLSLYLSGSYSTVLEKIVDVNETTEDGVRKTEVELLIERIQKIQKELPDHDESENEKAFNDAAEEQFESLYRSVHINQRARRKLL